MSRLRATAKATANREANRNLIIKLSELVIYRRKNAQNVINKVAKLGHQSLGKSRYLRTDLSSISEVSFIEPLGAMVVATVYEYLKPIEAAGIGGISSSNSDDSFISSWGARVVV